MPTQLGFLLHLICQLWVNVLVEFEGNPTVTFVTSKTRSRWKIAGPGHVCMYTRCVCTFIWMHVFFITLTPCCNDQGLGVHACLIPIFKMHICFPNLLDNPGAYGQFFCSSEWRHFKNVYFPLKLKCDL